jgi:autotransporter-associated beta strand protein
VNGTNSATLKLASSETIGMLAGAPALNLQANALTLNSTSSGTYSGVISNSAGGSIVKNGNGAFTLAGTNAFSAAITLNAGTLLVSNSLALGGSTATLIATGGTLTSSGTQAVVLANSLSLSGTLGLGDANNNGALTLSGSATMGGTLTLNTLSQTILSGVISGSYGLSKTGNAELILSGVNPGFGGRATADLRDTDRFRWQRVVGRKRCEWPRHWNPQLSSSETMAMLSGSLALALQSNTLTVNSTSNGTFTGASVAGPGARSKSGNGTWTLGGTVHSVPESA